MFFHEAGRGAEAEAAVREALEIHQRVLADGRLKHSVERYVVRNFVNLGRILAAAGRAPEAEQSYRKAVKLLDQLVKELPDWVYPFADLARTLPRLANLLKDLDRGQEAQTSAVVWSTFTKCSRPAFRMTRNTGATWS